MADRSGSHDFVYVHTDIPAGMTIREWRAQQAASSPAATRRSGVTGGWERRSVVRMSRAVARALARPGIARA